MKKTLVFLLIILNSFNTFSQVGWISQNSNTLLNLHDIRFVNNEIGWCIGQEGLILKTTNSGLNWFIQNSTVTKHLLGLKFVDQNTGIIVGGDNYGIGVILKTTNGGVNWDLKSYGEFTQILDLCIKGNTVYAVGTPMVSNLLLKSTNLGENWVRLNTGYSNSPLYSLFFKNETTGWVSGGIYNSQINDALYKTTDGGITWQNQSQNTTYHRSIYYKDADTGWVIGPRAYSTTNSGNSWFRVNDSLSGGKIYFVNPQVGWILSNYLLKTTNGGISWKKYLFGSANIRNLNFIDENVGWLCGDSGVILKTTTGGATVPGIPTLTLPANNSVNQELNILFDWNDIQIADKYHFQISLNNTFNQVIYDNNNITESQIYLNCQFTYNTIYYWRVKSVNYLGESNWSSIWNFRTKTVPNTWYTVHCGNNFKLNDINFIDSLNGFSSGNNSTLYKTTNSGFNWYNIYSNSGADFKKIYLDGPNTIYVTSNIGKVFKSINAGINWQIYDIPEIQILNSISVNNNFIIIASNNGKIAKSSNNGQNWLIEILAQNEDIISSYNIGNYFWLTSSMGSIFFSSNSGITWNAQNSGTNSTLTAIYFYDNINGFSTGDNGIVLKTTNSGLNWINLSILTGNNFNDVIFQNQFTGWLIGQNGIIRKTTNGGINWGYQISNTNSDLNSINFISNTLGFISGDSSIILRSANSGGIITSNNPISSEIPSQFSLSQNYPNPFNPVTKIKFDIPAGSSAAQTFLSVYDILGREIAVLVNEQLNPGTYEVVWDASAFPSGVYFYTLSYGDFNNTKKMVLLK